MVSSNFTQVRMSEDGKTLRVTGISDEDANISEIRVAVAAVKPIDPMAVGQDLAPIGEQIPGTVADPDVIPWNVDVPITPGMFSRGDMVLVAGTAVHVQPLAKGEPELETWLGCTTVMLQGDAKTT